jgi:hypothetical protein
MHSNVTNILCRRRESERESESESENESESERESERERARAREKLSACRCACSTPVFRERKRTAFLSSLFPPPLPYTSNFHTHTHHPKPCIFNLLYLSDLLASKARRATSCTLMTGRVSQRGRVLGSVPKGGSEEEEGLFKQKRSTHTARRQEEEEW